MTTILDPTAELHPIQRQLAPREKKVPDTLALVDISKPKGNLLLERLGHQIQARFPKIQLQRYVKPTFAKPAPDDLRRRIAESNEFVLLALAD